MRGRKGELVVIMEYLCIEEWKNATLIAPVEKKEESFGGDPTIEPINVGAVNAIPAQKHVGSYNGQQPKNSALTQSGTCFERRICYFATCSSA